VSATSGWWIPPHPEDRTSCHMLQDARRGRGVPTTSQPFRPRVLLDSRMMHSPSPTSRPALPGRGWHWLYTRGYSPNASPEYAFHWMIDHAPFGRFPRPSTPTAIDEVVRTEPVPVVRTTFPGRGGERLPEWEIAAPDRIVYHDRVSRNGSIWVEGEERHAFFGVSCSGSVVELTVLRHPVAWAARIGFVLAPSLSRRSTTDEAEIFAAIDRDFARR
jgi:hypothetical protein